MKTIYMYHCFYYAKDDEYGYICEHNHELVFFNNREDAEEYRKDFESNRYRLESYTHYSSSIKEINENVVY